MTAYFGQVSGKKLMVKGWSLQMQTIHSFVTSQILIETIQNDSFDLMSSTI